MHVHTRSFNIIRMYTCVRTYTRSFNIIRTHTHVYTHPPIYF